MHKSVRNIRQSYWNTAIKGVLILIAFLCAPLARAQQFDISQVNDSLWNLTLTVDGKLSSTWELRNPVYRFSTADINGDGSIDAVVGVYRASRYFKTPSRRVFVFKNFEGDIRPLWLGSRLGGELIDFAVTTDGKVRAIEKNSSGTFEVTDYGWHGFGLSFDAHIASCATIDECYKLLHIY
jgi:hypothetical protein